MLWRARRRRWRRCWRWKRAPSPNQLPPTTASRKAPAVQPPLENVNLLGGVRRSDTAEDNMSSASSANGDHDLAGFLPGQRKGGYGFVQQQPQGGAPLGFCRTFGSGGKESPAAERRRRPTRWRRSYGWRRRRWWTLREALVSPVEKGATSQEEREEEEEMEAAVAVAKATRAMRARPSEQQQSSVGHTPERRDSKEDMMDGTTRKSPGLVTCCRIDPCDACDEALEHE